MITLTKGATQNIIYTATEKAVLANPYFLFVVTNQVKQNSVKFVVTNVSSSLRYDQSSIVVNDYFAGQDAGLWTYNIYEQASSTNTDPAGLNMVEEGYLQLNESDPLQPDIYAGQNTGFKTYNQSL